MLRLILSLNSMMNAIALLKQLIPSTQHSITAGSIVPFLAWVSP
ncbi:hypothetical protein [Coleofasciculus sp. F4-SAH-05]